MMVPRVCLLDAGGSDARVAQPEPYAEPASPDGFAVVGPADVEIGVLRRRRLSGRRAGTDEGLDLGERQPLLVLILAAPVAIARLALFVGFKEENLYKTFFGIKPHGQIRSIV